MDEKELIKKFREIFQREPEHVFFCPGRINLIGEHIDYNGGQVMPCAISKGTYLAVARNIDKKLTFSSLDFAETASLHLQSSYSKSGKEWFNYPLGIINELMSGGYHLSGMDMLYSGNLPVGAGLSSSASIEVLTAFAINYLSGLNLTKKSIALLCQKVENEFIGVSCGIMDQFAVAMGKKDQAILLNCDTVEHIYIPFELKDLVLAVINTMKQRKLSDSKYNERFIECGMALKLLKLELDVKQLCDIDINTFEEYIGLINDPVLKKRALHVISENERVKSAVTALSSRDILSFGSLMFDSHQSLKELYEVTGFELDTIVEYCLESDECIGARMTGAGFGGCAIALVHENKFEKFSKELSDFYQQKTGVIPEIFASAASDGVRIIK